MASRVVHRSGGAGGWDWFRAAVGVAAQRVEESTRRAFPRFSIAVMALGLAMRYWRLAPPAVVRPDWLGLVALLAALGGLWAMQLIGINISRIMVLPAVLFGGWLIFVIVLAPVLWLARTLELRESCPAGRPP